jgi:hypothetical protein
MAGHVSDDVAEFLKPRAQDGNPDEKHTRHLSPSQPEMLEKWRVARDEVETAALGNLAAALANASIEYKDIDGVRLGFVGTTLPFKSALTLAPNLRDVVSPILGWPLHAVVPDRDFLYLWDARHRTFLHRVGGVVVKEFAAAPYPLTTEVFEIRDDGITAIRAF